MGRHRALRRAAAIGAVAGLAAAVVVTVAYRGREAPPADHSWPIPGELGGRVLVEVLNGAGVDGLARDVTRTLRREGLDVVSFGTAPERSDSTIVYVRRGDSTAGVRIRDALGLGRIEMEPDERLLLDVSVLLGRDAAALGRNP